MKKAEDKPILMEKAESLPEVARRSGGKAAKSAPKKTARLVLTDPEAEVQPILMEVAKSLPKEARTNDAGETKKSAAAGAKAGKVTDGARGKDGGGTKTGKKASAKRAKAKKPNEKITPASIFKKTAGIR